MLMSDLRRDYILTKLTTINEESVDVLNEYNEINDKFALPEYYEDSEKMEFLMKRQGELQDKIDALGAWDLDTKLNIAMDALRCPEKDAKISVLSGGERRRVAFSMGYFCFLSINSILLVFGGELPRLVASITILFLPFAGYLIFWIPDLLFNGTDIVDKHFQMASYHTDNVEQKLHPYSSSWFTWPIMLRPM